MHLLGGTLATLAVVGTARMVNQSRVAFGGRLRGARLERVRQSPNHNGATFVNPVATRTGIDESARGMLRKWLLGKEVRVPRTHLPVHRLAPEDLAALPVSGLRITWMGHASALIEIDGVRVLTDPVWSERVSPSSLVGPARFQPAPIALGDLPALDVVVISHDHYDHLDHATIAALAPTGVRFVVPLGVGVHLVRWGVDEDAIVELDWWQRAQVGGLTFVATPARHFSGRGLRDRNQTLWASWVLAGPHHRVYFGGDSGAFDGFREIGEREGPFDATLMPIGAYNDAWRAVHMNPEEAIAAHRMLRGDVFIPIHWGTFNLAFHDWFEPIERLVGMRQEVAFPVLAPLAGQPVEPDRAPGLELEPWWRDGSYRAVADVSAPSGAPAVTSPAPR